MHIRRRSCLVTIALLSWGPLALAQPVGRGKQLLPPVGSTPILHFEQIADSVSFATSTRSKSVGANSCVIVNNPDVFLLDPGESPATARALVNEIKTVTDKPDRFVAVTIFILITFDGNQIFGPEVMLITPDRSYHRLSGKLG